MVLRKVKKTDDFEAIANVYVRSWQAAYKGIASQDYLDALTADRWKDVLSGSALESFVLLDGANYVGTCAISPARDEAMAGWGEIVSIYLLPEYFGKGCGKKLLCAAQEELHRGGYSSIYLWVLAQNERARSFYERNGFAPRDAVRVEVGGKELEEVRYVKQL